MCTVFVINFQMIFRNQYKPYYCSIMKFTHAYSFYYNVSEVLNVHVNESKKNLLFLERFFSPSSEKLTFEKENVIF